MLRMPLSDEESQYGAAGLLLLEVAQVALGKEGRKHL